jgi:MoxR-like ATPase
MSDSVEKLARLQANLEQVIIGKPEAIRLTLTALLARGHLLIEDIPGVGKTTLARALARSLACPFQRIQFTSDLLPSDILGTAVFIQSRGEFEFRPGPVFTSILLADEINRTTPRTQSALLEAMNERQVTIEGRTYPLPRPFLVIATQNPLEHHGTFPLPDSQLDRFLISIQLGYPDRDHELEILRLRSFVPSLDHIQPVLSAEEVLAWQDQVDRVKVEASLLEYAQALSQATRGHPRLRLGVSPRGALALKQAAKAHALLAGRDYTIPDDFKRLALPVFAHRLLLGPQDDDPERRRALASEILEDILDTIPVPR